MNRTFRPLSLQIYTGLTPAEQQSEEQQPDGVDIPVPAPSLEAPEPIAAVKEPVSRPDRRLKNSLKERVQAGTAGFAFDALLDGVSTLRAPSPAANGKDGAELVWIAPGEFLMGSDDGELRERPMHPVFVDGFWIYKNPVTVEQFRRFYADIERTLQHEPPWGWQDDHPIVNVSWDFAMAYAQWAGASLPTEAEWERAARGVEGRCYPWGNEWDPANCCNSVDAGHFGVAPVGSHPQGATPEGVMDMAGNVWEWTADWYAEDYYMQSPQRNPCGPLFGTHRTLRGGSWGNGSPLDYRAVTRVVCEPSVRGGSIGFRCIIRADALPPHFVPQDSR